MFDFAWSELMVIGLVALIVIGPKDLPRVLRAAGKWVSKARAVAREFQGSVEQMIRESELEEVRREVEKVTSTDFDHEIKQSIDPKGEIESALAPPSSGGEAQPAGTPAAAEIARAPEPAASTPAPETKPEPARSPVWVP